jgi:thiamine-monophosphate kinase
MQTLAHIGEDELIRRLTDGLPSDRSVIAGPGDDCAVLRAPPAGTHLLFKTDAVVEHIHFLRETPPRMIGRKALARVISDIAAMGGQPTHALVTIVVRRATEVSYVEELYAGIREVAAPFGINIVGGETSRGDTLVISISLLGHVSGRRWSSRRGGKAGDVLLVTGRLGGSIRGKHLEFTPRVKEGQWLVNKFSIHAMMDISDGLAKDLPRLADASGLDFVVNEAALPRTPGCTPEQAWGDGEDYELLLAVAPKSVSRLRKEWHHAFPDLPLTAIGSLVPKGEGIAPPFQSRGWDHFASRP